MTQTTARMALAEFLALPEKKPALEYEEGRATQKVSPKGQHSRLQGALVALFEGANQRRQPVLAFPELRTTFGGRSYVPDVSVYRRERVPRTPDGEVANDFLVPPDIAVEIVSPGQSVNALVRRCLGYTGQGVQAALLVDPADRSVILFRPGAAPAALRGADQIDLSDILPDFRLTVPDLFATLRLD